MHRAGFLRLPPRALSNEDLRIRSPIVSHGAEDDEPLSEFLWDGNRDYSPWLTVPLVCAHWVALGGEDAVVRQASKLADVVESRWCRKWNARPYCEGTLGQGGEAL